MATPAPTSIRLLAKTGVEHALQFPWLDQERMDLTVMLWFKVALGELSFMASHSTQAIKGVRAFPRTWHSGIGMTAHVRRATFEFTNNTYITFCAGPASDYSQLIMWLVISLCVPHGTVCSCGGRWRNWTRYLNDFTRQSKSDWEWEHLRNGK